VCAAIETVVSGVNKHGEEALATEILSRGTTRESYEVVRLADALLTANRAHSVARERVTLAFCYWKRDSRHAAPGAT